VPAGCEGLTVPLDGAKHGGRPEAYFTLPFPGRRQQGRSRGLSQGSQRRRGSLALLEVFGLKPFKAFLYGPLAPPTDLVDPVPREGQCGNEKADTDEYPQVRFHVRRSSEWLAGARIRGIPGRVSNFVNTGVADSGGCVAIGFARPLRESTSRNPPPVPTSRVSLSPVSTPSKTARTLLHLATVFLTGGAIMVVELLGVRLISPFFGTGLHVWAALISVALLALAVGYFAGGYFADRHPNEGWFFALVALGAAGTGLIPLYAPLLIPAFEPAGLRAGALLAAAVTFFPPLFLLACVSPFAIRLSAASIESVGMTAGRVYAVSTLGSVAGTLLTGFLLAPLLDLDVTLRLTALVVALPALIGLVSTRRRAAAAAAIGAILLVPAPAGRARPGDPVFSGDTPFQRIEVLDREGKRWLYLDGCVHTHLPLSGWARPTDSYVVGFEMLPGFRPDARSMLLIGLGGGALLRLLSGEAYETTVVEIDPIVARVAREHFRTVPEDVEVITQDARPWVRRTDRRFDLVALDVCGSDLMPEHLSTVEFFRDLKGVLSPGGVVAMNSIGPTAGRSLRSFGETLRAAFRHVRGYATVPGGDVTNVIWYASDQPLEPSWVFENWEGRLTAYSPGEVLTDRWNPVNHWNAPWAREIRRTHDRRYSK
jgi:spermidine synthase